MAKRNIKATLARKATGGSDDWETPDVVLERVRRIAPIGLDPCTSHENPCEARHCYVAKVDGLDVPWVGLGLSYVNPPYSEMHSWARKIDHEASQGVQIISLVPARTDTKWWATLRAQATAIGYWQGRIKFSGASQGAPFPSAVIAHNIDPGAFMDAFGDVCQVDYVNLPSGPDTTHQAIGLGAPRFT